jgi:hypothetical protein
MGLRARTFRIIGRCLAAVGAVLLGLLVAGVALDIAAFDRTRGGNKSPYTDYTGTPIDWDTLDVTQEGMARRGRVVNVLIDCTTGMMHFDVYGFRFPFREFSERALVVHKPREACEERGFAPRF